MNLRSIFLGVALGALAVFAPQKSEAFPDRPVRLIIPFGVGGNNDIVGRFLASELGKALGQQVVPDNRGGAGGVIGTEAAAHANPDGYTLLLLSSAFPISASLYKLPYDQDTAFSPIAKLLDSTSGLVVGKTVPANNVKEFIALLKANPGKYIATATGVGGLGHLSAELFRSKADVDYKIVMFKGGGEMIADMMGGHSHFFFTSLVQALPNLKAGETKILGTAGTKRSFLLPDVPTISEAGLPGYEVANWWGLAAPAGTPPDILAQVDKALQTAVATEEFKKWAAEQGLDISYLPPAEFKTYIDGETSKWADVIKSANIKVEQ